MLVRRIIHRATAIPCAFQRRRQPSALVARLLSTSTPSTPSISSTTTTTTDDHLQHVLQHFDAPVRYCVAYGSAVFPQRRRRHGDGAHANAAADDDAMVDFIFGVTHPQHWHSLNLRQHPDHYSTLMRLAGSRTIQSVQEHMGASIYYNTNTRVAGRRIKYGVMAIDHLLRDLEQWETMYVAGRLQKPVRVVRDDARVRLAVGENRRGALRAAMLLLPGEFTEEELFTRVTGLSYVGDIRMKLKGEDPHKVFNIVYRQLDDFRRIYTPLIDEVANIEYVREGKLRQDKSVRATSAAIRHLPPRFRERLIEIHRARSGIENMGDSDKEDFIGRKITELALSPRLPEFVRMALEKTVLYPSITQSLKGLLTAGVGESMRYAARKLQKGRVAHSSKF